MLCHRLSLLSVREMYRFEAEQLEHPRPSPQSDTIQRLRCNGQALRRLIRTVEISLWPRGRRLERIPPPLYDHWHSTAFVEGLQKVHPLPRTPRRFAIE